MLIVFEGIDGSGKTSLCQAVKLRLIEIGLKAIVTSEFGRADDWSVKGKAELLAARNQREQYQVVMTTRRAHQRAVLDNTPHSTILLMDRYLLSTLAYQSGEALTMLDILAHHQRVSLRIPNTTFLLKAPPELAIERLKAKEHPDVFDRAGFETFRERCWNFRIAAKYMSDRGWNIVELNGAKPVGELCDQVISHFEKGAHL